MNQECGYCSVKQTNDQGVSQEEVDSAASNILNVLGVKSCEYSQDISQEGSKTLSAAGVIVSPFAIGGVATTETTIGGTNTSTKSIGCEQVALTAIKYVQTKKSLIETLNCTCTTIDQSATAINSITLEAHENSQILCNININQTINIKTLSSNQITDDTKSKIQQLTTDYLTSSVDTLLKSASEAGSTPTASKTITDVHTEINSEDINRQINQKITSMLQSVSGTNNITIKIYSSVLAGTECNFNQNIILELIATNILSSAMDIVYNTETFRKAITEAKTTEDTTSTGIATITKSIGDTLEKVNKSLGIGLSMKMYFIIFIVIMLIFFGVMFYINRKIFLILLILTIIIIITVIIILYVKSK